MSEERRVAACSLRMSSMEDLSSSHSACSPFIPPAVVSGEIGIMIYRLTYIYVAVPGRKQTSFHRVFQLHLCVESTISQNFR